MLDAHKLGGEASAVGETIVVRGPEPIEVASVFQHTPGIRWIAAGFAGPRSEIGGAAVALAKLYLRRGDRFSVGAEGTGGALASDVAGAVTSKILDAVKGALVSENPRVIFRAAEDGKNGAVGVEVRSGPGGVPTGVEGVTCMVSGGVHSAVTAWMALLGGFRVRLVHAAVSDQSLLAVARLYSELSNRVDPKGLSLEVLGGGPPSGLIARYASGHKGTMFGGFHSNGAAPGASLRVSSPLYLLPEEKFAAEFDSLGVKAFDFEEDWHRTGGGRLTSRGFSGGPADVSAVIDGLA